MNYFAGSVRVLVADMAKLGRRDLKESVDELRVELAAAAASDFSSTLFHRSRRAVRTLRGDGVEGVSDSENA